MEKEESSVEKLKRKLYARGAKPKLRQRRELEEIKHEAIPEDWKEQPPVTEEGAPETEPEKESLTDLYEGRVKGVNEDELTALNRKRMSTEAVEAREKRRLSSRIIRVVFIASFVFFLVAVGFAAYFLIGGRNQVSCDNVVIGVSGPRSIASGKLLSLDIQVQNNNPVSMEQSEIEVLFPKGTRDADDTKIALANTKKQIGTIEIGERVRSTVRAVLFGQEQTEQKIETVVTYNIEDSNASFSCKKEYAVNIATAPISVSVEGLEEISSGQELELDVIVSSNSEELVPDQRLVVNYPFGFEFVSADPEPTFEDNVWELGDIAPNKEYVLKIRGVVQGQGTESRVVRFNVGERDSAIEDDLSAILQKIEHPLLVTRPFLELVLKLNDKNDPQVVTKLGKEITGELKWRNTLPDALHDVEIDVMLDGIMFIPSSVSASDGFFRSVDDTLTWTSQTTNGDLKTIEPGEEGTLSFAFQTNTFAEGTSVENPFMQLESAVRARRISENASVPQKLERQTKKTILFETDLDINAYALYGVGAFTNTGPHPPRANKRTTYTAVWEVTNTANNMSGVTVKGTLPIYVDWLDTYDSPNESVLFNPVTREIIWTLGDLPRGTGNERQERKLSLQLSLTPSVTQVGDELDIIENTVVRGVDDFTNTVLEQRTGRVTTLLYKDPFFDEAEFMVEM